MSVNIDNTRNIEAIAYIRTDFEEKFGIPRQSGVIKELKGYIEFEPKYRSEEAIRGLEGYNYLWIIWGFQVPESKVFNATVRPPRLGGNERVGVFATRSPYRPNRLGLSSVKIEEIISTDNGPIIAVSGIDMRDHTPIYDIKPYLKYTDSHTDSRDGFAANTDFKELNVIYDDTINVLPVDKQECLIKLLEQDPRPSYHDDSNKIYGVRFAGYNIRFRVCGNDLTIIDIEK